VICSLGLVTAHPNWPITLAPLIAQHHWERHYHQLCMALAGVVCVYHLFVVHQTARVLHASIT